MEDIKSNNHQTAFLSAGKLYLIDHPMEKSDINSLTASKVPKLCDLIQLEVGAAHFLALKKSIIPGIKDFSTDELIDWVGSVGFPEC